jgi:hypothetical protein
MAEEEGPEVPFPDGSTEVSTMLSKAENNTYLRNEALYKAVEVYRAGTKQKKVFNAAAASRQVLRLANDFTAFINNTEEKE